MMKCLCVHCSTPLDFDAEGVGQVVACPSCGLDTTLYRQAEEEPLVSETAPKASKRNNQMVYLSVVGFIAMLYAFNIGLQSPQKTSAVDPGDREFVRELIVERETISTLQSVTKDSLTLIALKDLGVMQGLDVLTVGALSKGVVDMDRVISTRKDIEIIRKLNFAWPSDQDIKEILEGAAIDVLALQAIDSPIRNLSLSSLSTLISLGFLKPTAIDNLINLDYLTLERIGFIDSGSISREAIAFKLLKEAGIADGLNTKAMYEDLRALGMTEHSAADLDLIDDRALLVQTMTAIGVTSTTGDISSWKSEERQHYIEGMKRRWAILKNQDDSLKAYLR